MKREALPNGRLESVGTMEKMNQNMTIAIAGTGYVGLSNAILMAQHHKVYAVDIVPEKVDLINQRKSPLLTRKSRSIWRRRTWI